MKKYFLNDGTGQQGPFTLEELKAKNITQDTPVWYDGLIAWTTAGQLDELKDVIVHTPPPYHAPSVAEEVKPVAAATTVATTATVTEKPAPVLAASPSPAGSSKKKTAWLSWILYLLVFGGVGYFIYQDMEKNKGNNPGSTADMNSASEKTGDVATSHPDSTTATNETHAVVVTNEEAAKTEPVTVDAPAAETKTNQPPVANTNKSNQPVTVNEKAKPTTTLTKEQQAEAQKLAQKKIEDEKKKLQAAQAAAAAKEKEYRNNWSKYITIGQLNIKNNDDGVEAFNIPVANHTNATLDKVTLRVDYMKKEKKVIKSEIVSVYGIPPGGGLNGLAPESKKGNNIKVFITGILSRKLHFCYPANNGNAADPYFCN